MKMTWTPFELAWLMYAVFACGVGSGVVFLAIFTVGNDIPNGVTLITAGLLISAFVWYALSERLRGFSWPYKIRLIRKR